MRRTAHELLHRSELPVMGGERSAQSNGAHDTGCFRSVMCGRNGGCSNNLLEPALSRGVVELPGSLIDDL